MVDNSVSNSLKNTLNKFLGANGNADPKGTLTIQERKKLIFDIQHSNWNDLEKASAASAVMNYVDGTHGAITSNVDTATNFADVLTGSTHAAVWEENTPILDQIFSHSALANTMNHATTTSGTENTYLINGELAKDVMQSLIKHHIRLGGASITDIFNFLKTQGSADGASITADQLSNAISLIKNDPAKFKESGPKLSTLTSFYKDYYKNHINDLVGDNTAAIDAALQYTMRGGTELTTEDKERRADLLTNIVGGEYVATGGPDYWNCVEGSNSREALQYNLARMMRGEGSADKQHLALAEAWIKKYTVDGKISSEALLYIASQTVAPQANNNGYIKDPKGISYKSAGGIDGALQPFDIPALSTAPINDDDIANILEHKYFTKYVNDVSYSNVPHDNAGESAHAALRGAIAFCARPGAASPDQQKARMDNLTQAVAGWNVAAGGPDAWDISTDKKGISALAKNIAYMTGKNIDEIQKCLIKNSYQNNVSSDTILSIINHFNGNITDANGQPLPDPTRPL